MKSVRTMAPGPSANHPTELHLLCGTQLLVPTVARTLIWLDRLPTEKKSAVKKAISQNLDKTVEALLVAEQSARKTVPKDVRAPVDERAPKATANVGDVSSALTKLHGGAKPSEATELPRRAKIKKK